LSHPIVAQAARISFYLNLAQPVRDFYPLKYIGKEKGAHTPEIATGKNEKTVDYFKDRKAINEVTSTKSSKLQNYLRPLIFYSRGG